MNFLRHCILITGLTALASTAAAQDNAADSAWLAQALQLRSGSIVAEIGAGGGKLSIAVARHIGPSGRVYSSELGRESLQRLRRAISAAALNNVNVIEGDPNRTNFPDGCCEAVFLRNVYHHFADPGAMNASVWRSLRPGGRLAVIDFAPRGTENQQPSGRAQGSQHGITMRTLVKELESTGFEVISAAERPDRGVYVVARKPGTRE